MKTFKVIYLDRKENELWTSITEQDSMHQAIQYANLILANSMNNDVFTFDIYEILKTK